MYYKHDNLPEEIKRMLLKGVYDDPLYKHLELKAAEDSKRAISKLRSVIKLELFKQNYITESLKNLGTDEAVEKYYRDNRRSFMDICDALSRKDSTRFDNTVHAMLFAIDLLDTYVGTLNELIHKVEPGMDFTLFDNLINISKQTSEALKDFHSDKKDGYEQIFADEADKIHDYIELERMPVFLRRLERFDKKNAKK